MKLKEIIIAVVVAALPLTVGAACLGDHEGDNNDHYAYWVDQQGQNWVNSYGECWRTINDESYHNTLEEALACGDAVQGYTVVTTEILVHFDFDKSDLRYNDIQRVRRELGDVGRVGGSVVNVNVIGHTDNRGTEAYNDALGMRRATALAAMLRAANVPVGTVTSMGELDPVDTTNTEAGHQANRRAVGVVTLEVTYIRRK